MKYFLKLFFKIKFNNFNNYQKAKKGTIFISNFTSYLDVFIYSTLPNTPIIAIAKPLQSNIILNFLFKIFQIKILEDNNFSEIINLIKNIKNGQNYIIFPEIQPNYKGSITKIYEDILLIANKNQANIIPITIDGSHNSIFAKKNINLKKKLYNNINIYFGKSHKIKLNDNLNRKALRKEAKNLLFKIMSENYYDSIDKDKILFQKLLDIIKKIKNKLIFTDPNHNHINYKKLILGSIILGNKISKETIGEKRIGLLLPNVSGALVTFFALQLIGKIPAILNFSNGTDRLLHSIKNSGLKYIYSSKLFIEKSKLQKFIELSENEGVKIIYLEDVKSDINIFDKISAIFNSKIIHKYLAKINQSNPNDIAIILFTSGSEGNPKAVALTHKNINSNIAQISAIIDFNPNDRIFNALPIFHSFGLVIGSLLPILSGISSYFYPSPIHYDKIPNLIYRFGTTISFGTNYFLKKYADNADNLDFSSVRYIFAGAETITSETKNIYFEKFGIRILEGYGATETSPVVTLNTPRSNKANSIGQILPKIDYKIQKIENIEGGGELLVKADNVMKGYLDPKNPDKIKLQKGFYNMRDIVTIDEDNHVKITGRTKRFIKIAGEMVSLNIIESYIRKISPNHIHAVISFISDDSKEDMILYSEDKDLTMDRINDFFKKNNIGKIFIPRNIAYRKDIPILNSGKIDYDKLSNTNSHL
jgi:acyl-[acyl-carrier-protein]-phospholipid O-acyltransferase/long-chain-fatty-acid--[acyl-carrier-protein] ligase